MARELTAENVRIVMMDILSDMSYWEYEGKEAEKLLYYIAGARDMADAVIKRIKERRADNATD